MDRIFGKYNTLIIDIARGDWYFTTDTGTPLSNRPADTIKHLKFADGGLAFSTMNSNIQIACTYQSMQGSLSTDIDFVYGNDKHKGTLVFYDIELYTPYVDYAFVSWEHYDDLCKADTLDKSTAKQVEEHEDPDSYWLRMLDLRDGGSSK